MHSVPNETKLGGVSSKIIPKLYSKTARAVRKIIGRLPKEITKAIDTVTKALPDIRNAKVIDVARISAQAEEDQSKAGHYQAITAFDTDSEDDDEDVSATDCEDEDEYLPAPVPASPGAAGPASAKRPCERQHQASQPVLVPRPLFHQGPERVTPRPLQAPCVSPQVARYEGILPTTRGGEMSASPDLASDDSLAMYLHLELDENHGWDTTVDTHDQREENTAGLADTPADYWKDTNGYDSGNEGDSEGSDGSEEAEEEEGEEEEEEVDDVEDNEEDDSSWSLSSSCYTPSASDSDSISFLDLGPPLLPAVYSEEELAFMNSRITTDPEAPLLPSPPLG